MIIEKQIEIAKALVATGLIHKVWHSVELIEDKNGIKFPAYSINGEQFYIGPKDTLHRFAYIRQMGVLKNNGNELVGGCSEFSTLSVPLRIVIFKDREKENHNALLQRLIKFTFIKGIKLRSISTNAFQLAKQESPIGDFAFDATTFYASIDVIAKIIISEKMCSEDICITHLNPICQ